ncbi:hypothetical protein C8F04DRAFT_493301 [Mycena alexandri]|uniref:Uncharacterized protein n=1 Tax=Mycena alexandri TaxID=1745969 RepID=A0AAD6RXJ0_9AGAR|nr:hypothetical protein C8F04DRAFT_493301 [Mycena alexandri]
MADSQSDDSQASKTLSARLRSASSIVVLHVKKHVGTGVLCSVAYFDPGNWSVDLQAGSQFGYRLLFVVLLAGLFATFLQVLATRLGCVTGLDLASHCRVLLYEPTQTPVTLSTACVISPLLSVRGGHNFDRLGRTPGFRNSAVSTLSKTRPLASCFDHCFRCYLSSGPPGSTAVYACQNV